MLEMTRDPVGVWAAMSSSAAVSCKSEHEARSEKRPSLICFVALRLGPGSSGLQRRRVPWVLPPPAGDIANFSGGTVRSVHGAIVGGLLYCPEGALEYVLLYLIRGGYRVSILLWRLKSKVSFRFFSPVLLIPSPSLYASSIAQL